VGARLGQPIQRPHFLGRNGNAVRNVLLPLRVMRAAARAEIEQPTSKPGRVDLTRVLVLELEQAAASATIAEGFPLGIGHLLERLLFPERLFCVSHSPLSRSIVARW